MGCNNLNHSRKNVVLACGVTCLDSEDRAISLVIRNKGYSNEGEYARTVLDICDLLQGLGLSGIEFMERLSCPHNSLPCMV